MALILVMVAAAVALGTGTTDLDAAPAGDPHLPLLVLAGVWLALELVALHLQFGDDPDNAEQITLSEVALCLGLLFSVPASLVIAALTSSLLLDLLRWRKKPIKVAFNAANRLVEVAVGLAVFQAAAPDDLISAQGWGALCLAATVSSLASALDVAGVITLSNGGLPPREFLVHVVTAVPIALSCATIAFIAGLALQAGTVAVAPLVLAFLLLLYLMRSSSLLMERHTNLASLHSLGGRLATAQDVHAILESTLEVSADLLVAKEVEAYVPLPQSPLGLLRMRRGPDGGMTEQLVPRDSRPAPTTSPGARDTLVASATFSTGHEVVLAARGRAEPMRPFSPADARLLEMVAHQAGPNLHTAQLIERLRMDALEDPLTGLLNRQAVLHLIDELKASQQPVTLVWLEVDLQGVNEALGHSRGDELLVEVGARLRAAHGSDTIGRVGGQEFALLLRSGPAAPDVTASVAAVLDSLLEPFDLSGVQVLIRASVGVAEETGWGGATGADLMRRADIAVRHARRTGRPVQHYTPVLETTSPERLALATDLQGGITRRELTLFAQPQFRLSDGTVAGVEMLVRWNHPRLGLLQPDDFVPLAEQTGLDRAMTEWILEASLDTLAGWRASGLRLGVSINITAAELNDGPLPERIAELLDRHGIPGHDLVLEVTESSLLSSTVGAAAVLHSLSALGVRVSIDDFGTGFSSLSHLRTLPVDEIKVDRGFIAGMLENNDDGALVRAVISLGQGLGLDVVAEGVEDEAILHALQQLGCDRAQGYHLARPMPVEEVADWLATTSAQ